ncbi:leukocyte surface antigen CD53-like [Mizuhopecten yessoensis]|uniref:Tetraspanin n=1 Tax=Mizuhopecten yessoensis TaxID=6573 RepID=A0A210QR91_MIZYE|nr:leukocyte surface antigen CD53-like [Mizuhopecten yessoensis]XP_021351955.1 leukocyte surface antigen CD53-like [Mizuhopecten yessoensis]XP_021351956.1 leukocyte surface antigen CD53-like [Mizuhopecten yessoensis]OWF51245.1 Tetraspanin-11 [Mizuhopecten yessoensis]
MAVDACGKFLKYSMFTFNIVIVIAGCCLVGFGIYTKTNHVGITRVSSVLGGNLVVTLSLLLIIAGAIVILLSFLGCCGAIKEVRCMLVTFFVLLFLMFVGFVVSAVLVYAFREKIEKYTLEQLRGSLYKNYGFEPQVTEAWDSMQQIFKCCGVEGDVNSTSSWAFYKTHSAWYFNQTGSIQFVPDSCCADPTSTPNRTVCTGQAFSNIAPVFGPPVPPGKANNQMYDKGCYTKLESFLMGNIKILLGVLSVIAFIMILGMVFSVCLCRRIQDDLYCD